jgi:hypothetical protein
LIPSRIHIRRGIATSRGSPRIFLGSEEHTTGLRAYFKEVSKALVHLGVRRFKGFTNFFLVNYKYVVSESLDTVASNGHILPPLMIMIDACGAFLEG